MNTLSERLKLVRGTRAQSEFSDEIGISQRSLSRYETGQSLPDAKAIQDICIKYGIEPRWLILGEGLMKTPTHDGTMRRDGTITHGGELVREQTACPRCTELLEKLVNALNKAMQTQDNAMQTQKQKEELLKENADLRAENARLQAELSLFAATAAEGTRTSAA